MLEENKEKELEPMPLAEDHAAGLLNLTVAEEDVEKPRGKRRSGAVVSIVAAGAILIAAAVVLLINAGRPEKLLASGWERTGQLLTERAAGNPMIAILEALAQETDGGKLTVSLSDFNLPIAGEDETFDLELYTSIKPQPRMLLTADSTIGGKRIDAQMYYDKSFIGVGSKTLFENKLIYGGTPGEFSSEAKGSFFDPYTGQFPLTPYALSKMDEVLGDKNIESVDVEEFVAATDAVTARYMEFLQSVVPEKGSGKLPTNGQDATVITYVYPSEKVVEMLRNICDSYLENPAVVAYFNTLEAASGSLGIYDVDKFQDVLTMLLDELDENKSSKVTVQYYLVEKAVAYMSMAAEPTYMGETVALNASIDFGTSTGEFSVTLDFGAYVTLKLNATQSSSHETEKLDWVFNIIQDGAPYASFSGGHQWDPESGVIQFSLAEKSEGEEVLSVEARGTLYISDEKKIDLTLERLSYRNEYEEIGALGMKFVWEPGVETPLPQETRNIFTLSEREAVELTETFADNIFTLLS